MKGKQLKVLFGLLLLLLIIGIAVYVTRKVNISTNYSGSSDIQAGLPDFEVQILAVDSHIIRNIVASGGERLDVVPCKGIFSVNLSEAKVKENSDTIFIQLPPVFLETPSIDEAHSEVMFYDRSNPISGTAERGVEETIRAQKYLEAEIKDKFSEDMNLLKMAESQAILITKNLVEAVNLKNKDIQVYF